MIPDQIEAVKTAQGARAKRLAPSFFSDAMMTRNIQSPTVHTGNLQAQCE